MKIARPRITIRRLTILVVVAAMLAAAFALWVRIDRSASRVLYHDAALPSLVAARKANPGDMRIGRLIDWHVRMRDKYLDDARYP
jgi:hypothetical protein